MDQFENPYRGSANNFYKNPYTNPYKGAGSSPTSQDLINLAKSQGGRIARVGEELGGGNRTILSTIGEKFKNTFNDFVEIISVPGQVVAGAISKDITIKEAIKENTRVSDVIFGDTNIFSKDGDPTTMQKIGDFIVRLPVDILSDPLTYVTFGASRTAGFFGKMGFGSNSKVSLYQKAAKELGKNIDEGELISRSLSDYGQEFYTLAKQTEKGVDKKLITETKEQLIERGAKEEIIDMFDNNVKALLKETSERPFDVDLAKKAISNMMETNPSLAREWIDRGGIKFFGKTILDAQRIGASIKVIPGMKWLDYATQPYRHATQALFDSKLTKVNGSYVRTPEEFYSGPLAKLSAVLERKKLDFNKKIYDTQKMFNLTKPEIDILSSSINTMTIPADKKLESAFLSLLDIKEDLAKIVEPSGVPLSRLDGWVGNILVKNDTTKLRGNSMFSKKYGAAIQAQNIKAIPISTTEEIQAIPEVKNLLSSIDNSPEYVNLSSKIKAARTIEDVNKEIGDEIVTKVKELKKTGKTTEEALSDKSIVKLKELQKSVSGLKTKGVLIGAKETAKLEGITDDLIEALGDDVDALNYLVDKENRNKVYKRVATTAKELKNVGIEGFDDNILTAWTVRGMQSINQSTGREFAQSIVRDFGKWADEAPDSYVSLSSALINDEAKQFAKLFVRNDGVEMRFHPAIAKTLDDMIGGIAKSDDEISAFLKAYDKLQDYYKAYLTTLFPMFHGRNAISNVFLNFLDIGLKALDPKTHGLSVDLIMKDRKINRLLKTAAGTGKEADDAMKAIGEIMDTKMFTDRVGHEWTYGELRSTIRDNNIAFNPNITGALDIRSNREGLVKFYGIGVTGKDKLKKVAGAPVRAGREVARSIEEQSRLINFVTNLIDTGDVTHATQRTKQFLFDYQYGLSKFEKEWMRRLIPFYSFTRFNLELQAKTLTSAPGKIASEIKFVQSLGSFFGGEPMSEEDRKLLPPWMENSLNLVRRKDGKFEVISGFGTPIEQPFQALSKSGVLGALSPIIKIPVEKLTGYDLFRGKMTSEVIDAKAFQHAPDVLKDFIGYVEYEGKRKDGSTYTAYVSLRPEKMHTLMSTPYSRFITTMKQMTDADTSSQAKILQAGTGIRIYSYEEELLKQRQEDELIRDLEQMLKNAGIRGSFTRGYDRKGIQILDN